MAAMLVRGQDKYRNFPHCLQPSGLMLAQRALDDDWEWGIARVRQRITMRFDLLAETCDEFGMMPATGDTARRLAEQLRRQWPESEDMPLYPAFRADANNGAG